MSILSSGEAKSQKLLADKTGVVATSAHVSITEGEREKLAQAARLSRWIGINVSSSTRCNVGCFNDSSSPKMLVADVYNSSGQLVDTVTLDVQAKSWKQLAMTTAVSGGYIKWRPLKDAYCYAVVVDNASNDGTFIPTQEYFP